MNLFRRSPLYPRLQVMITTRSNQPPLPSPLLPKAASSSRILWRQVHHLGAQHRIPLKFAPHLPPLLALLGLLALLCLVGQLIVPQRLIMRKEAMEAGGVRKSKARHER